jgi:hypothetical protein
MRAPLIKVAISSASEVSVINEKGHRLGLFAPPMALEILFSDAVKRGRVRPG